MRGQMPDSGSKPLGGLVEILSPVFLSSRENYGNSGCESHQVQIQYLKQDFYLGLPKQVSLTNAREKADNPKCQFVLNEHHPDFVSRNDEILEFAVRFEENLIFLVPAIAEWRHHTFAILWPTSPTPKFSGTAKSDKSAKELSSFLPKYRLLIQFVHHFGISLGALK